MANATKPLPESQLLQCLNDFCNFPITPDLLKGPTPQMVVSIFECFMKDLKLNVEAMNVEPFKFPEMFEHRELYEDILPFAVFTVNVQHIMKVCGMSMSSQDIADPKPKRTKKMLNYLCLLWNHVIMKFRRFHAVEETIQNKVNEKEMLVEKLKILTDKCDGNLLTLQSVNPEKEKLLEKSNTLDEKLKQMEKIKGALIEKNQSLKTEEADIRKTLGQFDVAFITEKEKFEDLDQVILNSPNRLKAENEMLKENNKETENKIKEMVNKHAETKKLTDFLQHHLVTELEQAANDVTHLTEKTVLSRKEASSVEQLEKTLKLDTQKMKIQLALLEKEEENSYLCEEKVAKLELWKKKQIEDLKKIITIHEGEITKLASQLKLKQDSAEEERTLVVSISKTVSEGKMKLKVLDDKVKNIPIMMQSYERYMQSHVDGMDKMMDKYRSTM